MFPDSLQLDELKINERAKHGGVVLHVCPIYNADDQGRRRSETTAHSVRAPMYFGTKNWMAITGS